MLTADSRHPHLFPDYPGLKTTARAPGTVSPATSAARRRGNSTPGRRKWTRRKGLRDRLRMLRGKIGDRPNKIRGVACANPNLRISNHIQKISLGVDLSGFLKL